MGRRNKSGDDKLSGLADLMDITTRFAPSPTGLLHLGHAYSALLNFEAGDRFILRIEDIDRQRCKPEFEAAIYEDLAWLGLRWEQPVLRQSERLGIYEKHLADLQERGLIYRCFKSRQDIETAMSAPHGTAPIFKSAPLSALEERGNLAEGKPYAWRLSLDAAEHALGQTFSELAFIEDVDGRQIEQPADAWRFGDVVLGRKDIGTSYHMASVIDDAMQGITRVIRGEDLREAAGLHRLLQELLGLPAPIYRHHKLLTNENGQRLSKRNKALSLRALRKSGMTLSEMRARLPSPLAGEGGSRLLAQDG
jgi:glutamyl-Q tRNA(Asp) synthetase